MDLKKLNMLEEKIKSIHREMHINIQKYCEVNNVEKDMKTKMINSSTDICLNSLRMIEEQKERIKNG